MGQNSGCLIKPGPPTAAPEQQLVHLVVSVGRGSGAAGDGVRKIGLVQFSGRLMQVNAFKPEFGMGGLAGYAE